LSLKTMNPDVITDHKICGLSLEPSLPLSTTDLSAQRRSEGGYSLVALLALMTVLALFAMAAAPRVQQQAQREREKEAIFRGEQVADAIRQYYAYRTVVSNSPGEQALPTTVDQLLEGVAIPGGSKKRQILRPSAARDPLTIEGEWNLVRPRAQSLIEFQQNIMFYTGNFVPQPRDAQMAQLQLFAVPRLLTATNTGSEARPSSAATSDDISSGPFVGVVSRSKADSVLTYYGIERHDQWIFTPLFRN
jgi:type II secretory pathway pseudopilin PulG